MKNVFENSALEYDEWYDIHSAIYQSEVSALRKVVPVNKKGIEIGVGTGRFSIPFNITIGVEPSANMAKLAEARGITVINSVAENLPFHNESFDYALMVTTVCFLSNIPKAFSEIHRVLKPQGEIILAIIDKNSDLGKKYEEEKSTDKFYKDAHFYSTEEITELLGLANFGKYEYWQTLESVNKKIIEQPTPGFGQGSFVVIKAKKLSD